MKILLLLAFLCAHETLVYGEQDPHFIDIGFNVGGDSVEYQNSYHGYRSSEPLRNDPGPVQSPLPLQSPTSLSQKSSKVKLSHKSIKKGTDNLNIEDDKNWTKREEAILKKLCKMYYAQDPGPGDAVAQMLKEVNLSFKALPYICVHLYPNEYSSGEKDDDDYDTGIFDYSSSLESVAKSSENSSKKKLRDPLKLINSLTKLVNKRGKKTLPKHGPGAQLIKLSNAVITLIFKVLQLIVVQFIRGISRRPQSQSNNDHSAP